MHTTKESATSDSEKSLSEFKAIQYTRLLSLCDDLLNEHEYSDVEKILASAIKMCPEQAPGYAKLGEFYLQFGKMSDALWCLEKAKRLDPSNVQNLVTLCMYYDLMGPLDMVKQTAEEILTLEPTNAPVIATLGCYFAKENQLVKAAEFLQEATTLDPTNGAAWFNLSIVYHKQGNTHEEKNCLYDAIGNDPFRVEYWCNLGLCHKSLGEYDDSLEYLWRANKMQMYDPSIVFEIAVVYALQKNKERTLETLRLAMDEDFPLHEEIQKEEAFAFLKSDEDFKLLLASSSN